MSSAMWSWHTTQSDSLRYIILNASHNRQRNMDNSTCTNRRLSRLALRLLPADCSRRRVLYERSVVDAIKEQSHTWQSDYC